MSDEPIIPGMEKDVEKVLAQTQATLDSINFIPLIGIEFTLVLLPFDPTEEPKYLCLLCDQRSDSRTFLQHLISIKHYVSYLQRYFTSLASALEQLTNEISEGYQKLVFHVIGKIEETYGRMKPLVINACLFESSSERISILRCVNNGKHIMESPEDKWMLEMVKPEFLENPVLLQDKFPLEKICEKKKLRKEEKPKFIKAEMSLKKNPKTTVNKSHAHTKNDKEYSESDSKALYIKPSTESKPSSHVSSRDSSKKKYMSSFRRYCRSRNLHRRESPYHSKPFVTAIPMSRSRFPGHERSHSRSHFPYYNPNKYSNVSRYGSRERDGTSRRQMTPPTTVHPKHSMSVNTSAYQLRPCSPDMYSAKYNQQKKEREIVNDKLILDMIKSNFVENPALLQEKISLKKITEQKKHEEKKNPKGIKTETYRSRERDGISRRQMSPPPIFHPRHSTQENFPSHHLRSCSPDMYSAKYHQQQKERSMSKRKRLLQEYEKTEEDMKIKVVKKIRYNEKNSENQTLYVEEWKKFSNQSSKELKMEGKDTNSYTFIPEWIHLWSKQMQKINDKEINKHMKNLKSNILGDIDMDKIRDSYLLKDIKPLTDIKTSFHNNHTLELMEEIDSDIISKPSTSHKRPEVTEGSSIFNSVSYVSINKVNNHYKLREKIGSGNELNVTTVLRQLSVLENQLGLLAPKIFELLSNSIVMEAIEPKSSIKLLTPENCMIFDTVKEKLKKQSLAGLVKSSLVNATMLSICNIELLMKLLPKFVSTTNPKSISSTITTPTHTTTSTSTPNTTPIVMSDVVLGKMPVARQSILALIAQCKVDATPKVSGTIINDVMDNEKSRGNIQSAKNVLSNTKIEDGLKKTVNEVKEKDEVGKKNTEQLSERDIINLLKNFRMLTGYEQDGLVTYLKGLWKKNPNYVKKFRKYIDMGPSNFKEDDNDDNYELSYVCNAI